MLYWYQAHVGAAQGFEIVFSVRMESDSPADSFPDDPETVRLIDAGVYEWFIARVDARCEGVTLASEYLGGCCYRSLAEFREAPDGHYADMVRAVVDEARDRLGRLAVHHATMQAREDSACA